MMQIFQIFSIILGLPITLITFFKLNSALVEETGLKGKFGITLQNMIKFVVI